VFLYTIKFCFSQNYTGILQDTLKQPIAFANVFAYLPDKDSTILTFTQTDIQGKFSLSCSDTNAVLQFAFIGYEAVHIPVKSYKNGSIIVLKPKIFTVQVTEIIEKSSIKQIGDTLIFNADAYRRGNERTVQDLIGRMPGFEVSKEGNISFGGKAVKEVLVEGDKIGQGDYRNVTQKLNAKVIEDVYVIPDYAENPLLADFNENTNLAINLTLKDSYKNQWLFDTDISGGIPELYSIKGNVTAIRTKTKLIADGKFNNIADYPNTDKFYPNNGDVNYISLKPIVPFQLYTSQYPDIENILYEKTNVKSGHVSLIRRFKYGLTLQLTADYYNVQQRYFQTLLQNFFLTNYPVFIQGLQVQRKKEQQFYTGLQITYLPVSLKHRAVYQVHFNLPDIQSANGLIGLQNIVQTEQYRSRYHYHYLEYDYKIKKNHVLLFKTGYRSFDTHSQYQIQPLFNLYVPATDTPVSRLYQNVSLPVQNYNAEIDYVQKKFTLINTFQHEQQTLLTNIDSLPHPSSALLNYQNNMNYRWYTAYSELKVKLYQHPKNKLIKLQASTRLMYGNFRWQQDRTLPYTNKQQFWVLPSVQYSTKITKKLPLMIAYQYQVDIPKIIDFQYAYTFTDFRTLNKGMETWFPRAYHNINVNTMYFNFNRIISIFSFVAYLNTKGRFNTFLTVDSLYTFSSVTNQNTVSHQLIGYFNTTKSYLKLKHRINAKTNVSSIVMPSDFNEFKRTVTNHTYRQSIGLSSIFRKWFEYELCLDYTLMQNRMQLHDLNAKFVANNHRVQPNIKFIFEYKNLMLVYHHFFVQQYVGQRLVQQWHWVNAYANYTHKKLPNWRFGIKGYNLLGLKNITETRLDNNSQIIQVLVLQRRIVLGEVSFYVDTQKKQKKTTSN
jgi:AraC-like DNA-binding protein